MNNQSAPDNPKKPFTDYLAFPGMIVLIVVIIRTVYRRITYGIWSPF